MNKYFKAVVDEVGKLIGYKITQDFIDLHKKLNIRKFSEYEIEEYKNDCNEIKIGDRVKLRSNVLEFINKGKFDLITACAPCYNQINEAWYIPIERDIEQLKHKIFIIKSFVQHQVMDKCCHVYTEDEKYNYRFPIGWIRNIK